MKILARFNNLKIRAKLLSVIWIVLGGFIFFNIVVYGTFSLLRINGQLYRRIIQGKDIIADVLPPPKYIIEAYLLAEHLTSEEDLEERGELLEALKRLESEYNSRQEHWLSALEEGELKDELTALSHKPAEEFFRILNQEFRPLLISNEIDSAVSVLHDKLEPLYKDHRLHIDRIVDIAKKLNRDNELLALKISRQRQVFLFVFAVILSVGAIFMVRYVFNCIVFPLINFTQMAKKIESGDLSQGLPEAMTIKKDEIGILAVSLENMRKALKQNLEKLKEGQDNLEENVRSRTRDLDQANKRLSEELVEHKRLQMRLDAQYSAACILSESASFEDAGRSIMKAVCERLGWDFGEIWYLDNSAQLLRCAATWHGSISNGLSGFEEVTRGFVFSRGQGLPGRVWEAGEVIWIESLAGDDNFPRAKSAVKSGLQSGFGLPVKIDKQIAGAICFFSYEKRREDPEVIPIFSTLGAQIGQFIKRKEAEEEIKRFNAVLEECIFERTKQLEEANRELFEANTMNQTLLMTLPFGMDIVDDQGNILALNPNMEVLFGKSAVGKKCWEVYKKDGFQCRDCPLKRGVALGETHVVETPGVIGDRIFQISHTGMAYKGKSALLEVFQDITERKRAEEELIRAHLELKSAQSQLLQSAKMASVGQLAGGVAHEINNPLTGVLNNVQLVKMIASQRQDFKMEDFKGLLNVIEESALRCVKITRSLLDFSRASTDSFQKVNLNEVADKVTVLISHEMSLQNISIEKRLESGLPDILGDNQLLQQVVFDLITNAKWAVQKKGLKNGLISLETGFDPGENRICMRVSDNGIGIPKENIDKIFEPFFTTKAVGEGTGLGLSIIYGIVNRHKGSIEVESSPGEGAVFKLAFPAVLG